MRHMVRGVVLLAATAILALSLAAAGSAGDYYGFNYLSPTIPTGCSSVWVHNWGCTSDGFNTIWDWSQITKNSGDDIALGFRTGTTTYAFLSYSSSYNGSTFHVSRSGLGVGTYNAPFCAYYGNSSSYVKCTSVDVG